MNVAAVRNVFKSAEGIVTDYLSSTTPTDSYVIKLLNGISIESKYIPKKNVNRGMFKNITTKEKINVSGKVTKHYKQKINDLYR